MKKHEVTQFATYTQSPLCTSSLKPPSDIATFAVAFVVFAVLVAVTSNFRVLRNLFVHLSQLMSGPQRQNNIAEEETKKGLEDKSSVLSYPCFPVSLTYKVFFGK